MRRLGLLAGIGLAVASAAALIHAPPSSSQAAGALNLRGNLLVVSTPLSACPSEAPAGASGCRDRNGKGSVSGLGSVTETYNWWYRLGPPTCPKADEGKPLSTTGRLVVAGKGEIQFALADGTRCIEEEPMRNEPQEFTITGGSGTYQGATGSGTLDRAITGGRGSETWTGTITVPGYEFDVTPPVLSGGKSIAVRAPRSAKRARVTYSVTATDAKDGQVPVTCIPKSGSRFKVGRSTVRCAATDSSANTASASFTITVRAPR